MLWVANFIFIGVSGSVAYSQSWSEHWEILFTVFKIWFQNYSEKLTNSETVDDRSVR